MHACGQEGVQACACVHVGEGGGGLDTNAHAHTRCAGQVTVYLDPPASEAVSGGMVMRARALHQTRRSR